ncbi:hypothetical protein EWH99_11900 [Sporolactobacillus sp. THM7-7]|nr:hypothetical protein EWH99_11900 [Sporolactobacillus sp. THM7-7]
MKQVLVFGGLSSWGFSLSEVLLEKGVKVVSISSAINDRERKQEEEREFFLGRNAFFHRADSLPEGSMDGLILADTFRVQETENKQLKKKMRFVLRSCARPGAGAFVFMSSTAIYGESGRFSEKYPVHPLSAEGKAADVMESLFVQELLKMKQVKAVIFRIDFSDDTEERKRRIADLTSELAFTAHQGLEVVHYIDRKDVAPSTNQKIRRLLGDRFFDR